MSRARSNETSETTARRLRRAMFLAVIVGSALLGVGVGRLTALLPAPVPRPGEVKPSAAPRQDLVVDGRLTPTDVVFVTTSLAGRIDDVLADVGTTVQRGEVVARLDVTFLEVAAKRARAELLSARRALDRARSRAAWTAAELTRTTELLEDDFATTADHEVAEATLVAARAEESVAGARLAEAQVALEQAELNLRSAEITAPASGVVLARNATVGQMLSGDALDVPLFVVARDLLRLQLHAGVGEPLAPWIHSGSTVPFTVKAYPGRRFEAVVRGVGDDASRTSGMVTYELVLDVDNREGLLRPGMSARVHLGEIVQGPVVWAAPAPHGN